MRETVDTEFFVNGFSDIQSFSEDFDDPTLCLGKDILLCFCNACASKSIAESENESDDSVTHNRPPLSTTQSVVRILLNIYDLHYYYTLC